jgi:hypothetical protein
VANVTLGHTQDVGPIVSAEFRPHICKGNLLCGLVSMFPELPAVIMNAFVGPM